MTDNNSIVGAMKPQDQIIYLLGQIQGELKAVHQTVEAQNTRQASINAGVAADMATLENKVADHGEDIAVIKASRTPRLTWPQVVTGIAAIAALILSANALFPNT